MPDLAEPTDRLPHPDPTRLTTAALQREITFVRELIAAQREIIEARLNGMDRALELLQTRSDRIPSDLEIAIDHLKAIHDERFARIDIQLTERDIQSEQRSRDSRIAVDTALSASKEAVGAALQAAKEAVGKTEMAFTKSIDQLGIQTQTEIRALDGKITEMKDRLEAAIGSAAARSEAANSALRAELLPQITGERTRGDRGEGRQLGKGALLAIIFSAIGALGVLVGFVVLLSRMSP